MPPVSQCRKMQTAKPDQEKKAGTRARRARACKLPIQISGAQASRAGAGCAVVVVVIINLCSCTSRAVVSWRREESAWKSRRVSHEDRSHFLIPKCYNSIRAANQAQRGE